MSSAPLGVQLSQYASGDFDNKFVAGNDTLQSAAELADLQKALEAGDITGRETANSQTASGAPLKVESLEGTLKLITFREADIVLWRKFPKAPAFNTVEEFNQMTSYGAFRGGFNREGELPETEDSVYTRRSQLVKFMGVVKAVTHPMTLVNTHIGNVVQKEINNGTLWMLRKADASLAFGNDSVITEEFAGLYRQHQANDAFTTMDDYFNSEVVIDCRGATLQEGFIEAAAQGIIENFGYGDTMFGPPKILSDFVKNFYGNKFIMPNSSQTSEGIMGQRVQSFDSQFGRISLNYDLFLKRPDARLVADAATSNKAPNAPTPDAGTPVTPVAADASGSWAASDAGDYFYAVAAINRYGESQLALMDATAATIAAGGSVDLTFTATASTEAATGFRVYRSARNAAASTGLFYPLFDIPASAVANGYDGGAAGVVRDRNRIMPDTEEAFMIEMNSEITEFKQLAPLMKMDLALLAPAYRFMILMYGTPLLYAPKKMVRFINIGKL